jgi:hypothetical protein
MGLITSRLARRDCVQEKFKSSPFYKEIMQNLISKFLKENPEWSQIILENDGVVYFRAGSDEPFSKTEFVQGSATRCAMEAFEAELYESISYLP